MLTVEKVAGVSDKQLAASSLASTILIFNANPHAVWAISHTSDIHIIITGP